MGFVKVMIPEEFYKRFLDLCKKNNTNKNDMLNYLLYPYENIDKFKVEHSKSGKEAIDTKTVRNLRWNNAYDYCILGNALRRYADSLKVTKEQLYQLTGIPEEIWSNRFNYCYIEEFEELFTIIKNASKKKIIAVLIGRTEERYKKQEKQYQIPLSSRNDR